MFPTLCRSAVAIPARGSSTSGESFPAEEPALGVVVFTTHRGERAEAILDAEGTWRCPELPVLDRVLNILYAPSREAGGDRPPGLSALLRAAAWLKGEVRRYRR